MAVQNVTVGPLGDLTIELSQGIVIELFVNAAIEECWRFFKRSTEDEHLVVTGEGMEK